MIISNVIEKINSKYNFIFYKNEILMESNGFPSAETAKNIIKENHGCDFFYETDPFEYSAVMLDNKPEEKDNLKLIPLRQIFWDYKDKTSSGLASRAHSFLEQRKLYKFCPYCGEKLTDDNHFTARFCPSCKKTWFPRIEPCIIILVSKGDKILLVKNKNYATDKYTCIAGFIEQGEKIEEAAFREVKEETGIEIQNIRYAGSQPWPFPDQLMLAFYADYKSGEIKIQEEELTDAGWFNRETAPVIPLPGSVAYNLVHGLI